MTSNDCPGPRWTRRDALFLGVACVAGFAVRPAAAIVGPARSEKRIKLCNPYSGEFVDTVFWAEGAYIPEALEEINTIFRDRNNDAVCPVDPALLDLLHKMRARMELKVPFQVVCGYRSPETNDKLVKIRRGVAKNSYHTLGKAIDLRVENVPLRNLQKAALALHEGGVGLYPKSRYLHVDTGPVRTW